MRIVCGAGSDEILSLLTHAYVGPGDEGSLQRVRLPRVSSLAILGSGGTPVVAKETNGRTAHIDALLAAVTPRTKIVFLANPNNPTGTYLPFDEVKRLAGGLPSHVLLVVDAAYAEYVTRNDYSAGIELVAESREYRDDAHVLENLRAGVAAARLVAMAPAHVCRCDQPDPRTVQRDGARDRCRRMAALADTGHIAAKSVAHNDRNGCRG